VVTEVIGAQLGIGVDGLVGIKDLASWAKRSQKTLSSCFMS
jgi:hypothetical protein